LLIASFISSCANLTNAPITQPTQSISFAIAQISKPTYTPFPTVTSTPTQIPTNTPEPLAQAEIILDTPTSEYIPPVAQNYQADAPAIYTGGKYILVDISQQHMYVYEGDVLVFSFVASTGMNN